MYPSLLTIDRACYIFLQKNNHQNGRNQQELPWCCRAVRSGSAADSNQQRDEQDGDYKAAAKKCFDSLVGDGVMLPAGPAMNKMTITCTASMKCFDSLVRDAASRICFVWSYDAIPLTSQGLVWM